MCPTAAGRSLRRPLRQPRTVCHAEVRPLSLWQQYLWALETNPMPTKAATSFVGFSLGDILAQSLEGASSLDELRLLRLAAYGLLLDGPVGHVWYRWLDGTCDGKFANARGPAAIATKTAADQLIWAPIMTCAFFAFLKVLEGHPELAVQTVQDKALQTVVANYCIWPAAHVISFKYVPSQQRVLYNNVIAIAWNCYLSLLASDSVGADADLTDLPALHDISARIAESLPVRAHFWLTDWLQAAFDLPDATMLEAVRSVARGMKPLFVGASLPTDAAVAAKVQALSAMLS